MTGSLPSELAMLTALEQLWLANNNHDGPIPPGIGNLTALVVCDLTGNSLTGISSELGRLTLLEELLAPGTFRAVRPALPNAGNFLRPLGS